MKMVQSCVRYFHFVNHNFVLELHFFVDHPEVIARTLAVIDAFTPYLSHNVSLQTRFLFLSKIFQMHISID